MLGQYVIQSDIYSPKCDTEENAQAVRFYKRDPTPLTIQS